MEGKATEVDFLGARLSEEAPALRGTSLEAQKPREAIG